MRTITINRRALTALGVAAAMSLSLASVGYATGGQTGDKKQVICHPVEGKGENGTGWNRISVSKHAVHFRDGVPKHVTKDGRADKIIDADEFCHELDTPTTTGGTTSTTTSSTSTTSTTSSPSTSSTTSSPATTTGTSTSSSTGSSGTSTTTSSTPSTTSSATAVESTTSTTSSPPSSVATTGPRELARTGVSDTAGVAIFAFAVLFIGALFYLTLRRINRDNRRQQ